LRQTSSRLFRFKAVVFFVLGEVVKIKHSCTAF
jgi:hypothetical protein